MASAAASALAAPRVRAEPLLSPRALTILVTATAVLGPLALIVYQSILSAPFFEAIERAGFVLVGVTNMPELGIIDGTENVLYGATRNPWNLEYSPGGSSGGSAACVAAGALPLAHGTDGGGSIRIPASHCALFGLKASRGRLLPGGFGAPPWPRLVEAGLSRTVRDTAMYLSVAEDPNTPLAKLGFVSGKAPRRLKIAMNLEGDGGQMPDPQVRAAIADTASLCSELGHAVSERKLPLDETRLHAAARQVASIGVAKLVDATAKDRGLARLEDGFEARAIGLREEAIRQGPFDAQIAEALPILKEGTAALDRFFQEWDVLLTPVVRSPVYKIGMRDQSRFSFQELEEILRDYVAYTALHNICGTTACRCRCTGTPTACRWAASSQRACATKPRCCPSLMSWKKSAPGPRKDPRFSSSERRKRARCKAPV